MAVLLWHPERFDACCICLIAVSPPQTGPPMESIFGLVRRGLTSRHTNRTFRALEHMLEPFLPRGDGPAHPLNVCKAMASEEDSLSSHTAGRYYIAESSTLPFVERYFTAAGLVDFAAVLSEISDAEALQAVGMYTRESEAPRPQGAQSTFATTLREVQAMSMAAESHLASVLPRHARSTLTDPLVAIKTLPGLADVPVELVFPPGILDQACRLYGRGLDMECFAMVASFIERLFAELFVYLTRRGRARGVGKVCLPFCTLPHVSEMD